MIIQRSTLGCIRVVVLVLSSLLDLLLRHRLEVLLHLLRLPELSSHHDWRALSGDTHRLTLRRSLTSHHDSLSMSHLLTTHWCTTHRLLLHWWAAHMLLLLGHKLRSERVHIPRVIHTVKDQFHICFRDTLCVEEILDSVQIHAHFLSFLLEMFLVAFEIRRDLTSLVSSSQRELLL